MLVIRLFRTGKRNQPFFKIVVTEKARSSRGGRFVEQVGFLNPLTKEKELKKKRIEYWLSKGAKPSDTLYNLLVKEKICQGKKIPVHKKKKGVAEKPASAGAEMPQGEAPKAEAKKVETKGTEAVEPKASESKEKIEEAKKPIEKP